MNPAGSISRRAFLRGTGAVAMLSAAPVSLAHLPRGARRASLKRSTFTPLLGDAFRMTGGGDDVEVVLAEINNILSSRQTADDDRFALVFRAPVDHARTEGIRTFRHPKIGHVSMFVAPIDRGVKALRYEAVINRS
jgi:hypothetical protein